MHPHPHTYVASASAESKILKTRTNSVVIGNGGVAHEHVFR
jgi:hypothetical protein